MDTEPSTRPMPDERTCSQCGAPLLAGASDWHCPKCLLGQASMPASPSSTASDPAGTITADGLPGPITDHGSRITKPVLHYFGNYELLEEIARGGMGVVYKARQVSLNRMVAVKLLPFAGMATPQQVQRFRTEAEAAANLQHPNIVAIYEVGEHEGQHYFSMEYVEGRDLSAIVRDTPLSATRAARYVRTIAEAVHYAHQRQTLHRDLKPSNVLIGPDDQPRITDFGLAKRIVAADVRRLTSSGNERNVGKRESGKAEDQSLLTSAATDLTVTGQILGTPGFMPPEQATAGREQVGPASDVYSIGAILYYLITARPPFVGETFEHTLAQLLNDDPPAPRLLNPTVERDLETICLKCLEKEPSRRYRTAEEVAKDLEAWQESRPIRARPTGLGERAAKWVRRRPLVAALAAGLVLTFLVGAGVGVWQYRQTARARRQADDSLAQLREAVTKYLSVIAANPRNKPTDPAFLREELLQTTVAFLENFTRFRSADPALERQRGLAYLGLSRIKSERGQKDTAVTNAYQARAIIAALAEVDPASVPLQGDLASADLAIGTLLIQSAEQAAAEQHLLRALDQWQRLTNNPSMSYNARRQAANTCNRLCDLYRRQNRPDDALGIQRRGLAVREALVAEFPRAWDEKLNVAIDYNSLALALASAPVASAEEAAQMARTRNARLTSDPARIRESEAAYRKAIAMYETLVAERPKDEATRSSLAISAWSFGNMLGALGKATDGVFHLEKALTNYQELAVQFPQKPGYKREVENTRAKIERLRAQGGGR